MAEIVARFRLWIQSGIYEMVAVEDFDFVYLRGDRIVGDNVAFLNNAIDDYFCFPERCDY